MTFRSRSDYSRLVRDDSEKGSGWRGKASRFVGDYLSAFASFSPNARLFLLGQALLWIGANQISLLLSLYLKRIGYSEDAIGGVLAMKALGTAVLVLPASFMAARFNQKLVLPVAALLTASANAAQALGALGNPLLAAAFLSGSFSTVFQVSAGPFFIRNSGEAERVHLFSLNGALSMGTGVLGSSLGGILKDGAFAIFGDEILAYRLALLVGALFILSAWIPFSRIREDIPRASGPAASRRQPPDNHREDAAERIDDQAAGDSIPAAQWLRLLLPGFLIGTGAGLTIPYLNLYFKDVFGLEDGAIGAAVAAGQVATFLGMASGPALARRIGKPWAVVGTQMASVPLILVLAWIHSLPLAIVAYLLRQSLMNLATPIQDIFLLEKVPQSRMIQLNAIRTLVWNGSWTIAARLSGWFIWKGGFVPSFTVTATLYALGTAFFWLFFIRGAAAQVPSSRRMGR